MTAYPLLVSSLAALDRLLMATIESAAPLLPALVAATGLSVPILRRLRGIAPPNEFGRGPTDIPRFVKLVLRAFADRVDGMPTTSTEWSLFWRSRESLERLLPVEADHGFWGRGFHWQALVARHGDDLPDVLSLVANAIQATDAWASRRGLDANPFRRRPMRLLHRLAHWWKLQWTIADLPESELTVDGRRFLWPRWLAGPVMIDDTSIVELGCAADLEVESQQMHHCADDYDVGCMRNRYRVMRLERAPERSTLLIELRPDADARYGIRQHRGFANAPPSALLNEAAEALIAGMNDRTIDCAPGAVDGSEPPEGVIVSIERWQSTRLDDWFASVLARK